MIRPMRFVIVNSNRPMPEIKITGVVDTWMIGISELGEGESMRAKMPARQVHATTVYLAESSTL